MSDGKSRKLLKVKRTGRGMTALAADLAANRRSAVIRSNVLKAPLGYDGRIATITPIKQSTKEGARPEAKLPSGKIVAGYNYKNYPVVYEPNLIPQYSGVLPKQYSKFIDEFDAQKTELSDKELIEFNNQCFNDALQGDTAYLTHSYHPISMSEAVDILDWKTNYTWRDDPKYEGKTLPKKKLDLLEGFESSRPNNYLMDPWKNFKPVPYLQRMGSFKDPERTAAKKFYGYDDEYYNKYFKNDEWEKKKTAMDVVKAKVETELLEKEMKRKAKREFYEKEKGGGKTKKRKVELGYGGY